MLKIILSMQKVRVWPAATSSFFHQHKVSLTVSACTEPPAVCLAYSRFDKGALSAIAMHLFSSGSQLKN